MRGLLFSLLCLYSAGLFAQSNELDAQYTPPANAKYNLANARLNRSGASLNSLDAPYRWAVKYDLEKLLKAHHIVSFEWIPNHWLGIEPQIGIMTNKWDMYTNSFSGERSYFMEAFGSFVSPPSTTDLSYNDLLTLAIPRSTVIPSFGLTLNYYRYSDRFLPDFTHMLQLGYHLQQMHYSLDENVSGSVNLPGVRAATMRRQQLMAMAGIQSILSERVPVLVEFGLVFAVNFLTAPLYSATEVPNGQGRLVYTQREDLTYLEPWIGLRMKVGMGFVGKN